MRYRIRYQFYESPMIGATYVWDEFDAPNDEVAVEHFRHVLEEGMLHDEAVLQRIDRQEISTELQRQRSSSSLT